MPLKSYLKIPQAARCASPDLTIPTAYTESCSSTTTAPPIAECSYEPINSDQRSEPDEFSDMINIRSVLTYLPEDELPAKSMPFVRPTQYTLPILSAHTLTPISTPPDTRPVLPTVEFHSTLPSTAEKLPTKTSPSTLPVAYNVDVDTAAAPHSSRSY